MIFPPQWTQIRPHRAVNLLLLAVVLWLVWGLRPELDQRLAGTFVDTLELESGPVLILHPDGTWSGPWGLWSWRWGTTARCVWHCERNILVVRRVEANQYSLFPGRKYPLPAFLHDPLARIYKLLGRQSHTTMVSRFRPILNAAGVLELVAYNDGTRPSTRLRRLSDAELEALNQ